MGKLYSILTSPVKFWNALQENTKGFHVVITVFIDFLSFHDCYTLENETVFVT